MMQTIWIACFLLQLFIAANAQLISIQTGLAILNVYEENEKLVLRILDPNDGIQKISAELGVTLNATEVTPCVGIEHCIHVGSTRLHISNPVGTFNFLWTAEDSTTILRDCFNLNTTTTNWFGGPERFHQKWPIQKLILNNFYNVPQDGIGGEWGAIAEPYWLNEHGAYIFVDDGVPLFIDQNSIREGEVCFAGKLERPFIGRTRVLLNYTIGIRESPRDAHLDAVRLFLGKPTSRPNTRIIERPIWSTWARYGRPINDEIVLEYAREIRSQGYVDGQLEIDDFWETCYGSMEFRTPEFANITDTVNTLKDLNYTVSLWVHPFINKNCEEPSQTALDNNYLVKNINGSVSTTWWNSAFQGAQHIDFTNWEAREWFVNKLYKLQLNHGINYFKFDAGETTWAPQPPVLSGDVELLPGLLTQSFITMCSLFGDGIEVRSGWRNQNLGLLTRMLDKDSNWGENNGLYTLITTLLQFNIAGYTMVLPDMIGGNGYGEKPTAELFVRWLQATTFMPVLQFSFVPWDYIDSPIDVVNMSKIFVNAHYQAAAEIEKAMERSILEGYPVNPPVWWADHKNHEAMAIDTQYMLGEDILVAPVIIEGATSRDVFIPQGTWVDLNNGTIYEGSVTIVDYYAPINMLPAFARNGSEAARTIRFNTYL